MNLFSLIATFIAITILFSSCNAQPEKDTTSTTTSDIVSEVTSITTSAEISSESESSDQEADGIALGYDLAELELELDLSDVPLFKDINYEYITKDFQIYVGSGGYYSYGLGFPTADPTYPRGERLNYHYTYLTITTVDGGHLIDGIPIVSAFIPIAILQVFNKDSFVDGNEIIVGSTLYTVDELEEYIMYEDDEYYIFDFRELLHQNTLEDFLRNGYNVNDFDYTWMTEVYDYFKIRENFKIKPIDS